MSQINVTATDNQINVTVGESRYYGSFYSTADQTNAGATSENILTYNNTDISNGVSIVSNSQITIANTGIYNIQFSAQIDKTDGGDDAVEIWLKKNGSNVDNSSTVMTLHAQDGKAVAAWNWFVDAAAGDYYQIAWHSADTNLFINYITGGSNPTRPAVPSVILTVNRVG